MLLFVVRERCLYNQLPVFITANLEDTGSCATFGLIFETFGQEFSRRPGNPDANSADSQLPAFNTTLQQSL